MPLHIELKPGEKIFLGGAVIENGETRSHLTVLNDVAVLREKDIISDADADSPCKRAYLAVQLMYMDPGNLARYHQLYWGLVQDILAAAPSTVAYLDEISAHILAGSYYQALKVGRQLIQYEKELMENAQQST
ncbi:MAG TPA: flagellar biosynthesis repressor FlbT [Thiobacillaceae bacterium]|nr:flagellar biosynthesis repressor FlbT [Thiobacillaceae bacterium]